MQQADGPERPKIVFPHIMKTAGTTLTQWIERHYHRDEVLWEAAVWQELFGVTAEVLGHKRLVRGHFGAQITDLFGERLGFTPIALLRDPVERVISHFWHLKRAPDNLKTLAFAKDPSFTLEAFLEHDLTRSYASNYQTANLSAPSPQARNASGGARAQASGEFNCTELSPVNLALAKAFIDRCEAVGICEDLGGFVSVLSARFGFWPEPVLTRQRSYREGSEEVSPETIRKIQKINEADEELYAYVKQRIAGGSACRSHPVSSPRNPLDASRCRTATYRADAPFWGEQWTDIQLHMDGTVRNCHRWSLSPHSALLFRVRKGIQYTLVFHVFRFVAPFQVKDVHLECNGAKKPVLSIVREEEGSGRGIYLSPVGTADGDTMRISFRIDSLISFNDVNADDPDRQKKGLALSWATLVADMPDEAVA